MIGMIITGLIKKLQEIHRQHGDLKCIAPGCYEKGFENITTEVAWIAPSNVGKSAYDRSRDADSLYSEKAVIIDFERKRG